LILYRFVFVVEIGDGCCAVLDALNGIIADDGDFILITDLQQQQQDENSSRNLRRNLSNMKIKQKEI
jgi:hypothetical protein